MSRIPLRTTFAVLALVACGSDSPSGPAPGDDEVLATASLQFSPADKSVEVGTSVIFRFAAVAHTVQFDEVAGRPAHIANAVANQSVSRTFDQVGVYPYHCTIHTGMTGTIRVLTAGNPAAPPPPPPPPPSPYP
jgi:plastocyanin